MRDLAALANSGGGIILYGVDRNGAPTGADLGGIPEARALLREFHEYVDSDFAGIDVVRAIKDERAVVAVVVDEAIAPVVFSADCGYSNDRSEREITFPRGSVWFRHRAKSEPGTTEDLAGAIDRRVETVRKNLVRAVTRVVRSPHGYVPGALSQEVRDSESPGATPIRIVDDPSAPAFRVVDYDKTHPFRQKEILAELHARRPDVPLNQFDLLAIRHTHRIDSRPELSHKGMYGTRQYSPRFLEWLLDQIDSDPAFLANARETYQSARGR